MLFFLYKNKLFFTKIVFKQINEDNLLNVFVTNRFTTIQNFRLSIVQNSKTFFLYFFSYEALNW